MPENDIKTLLKDLNKVLKDQTKSNLTQQQRLDLSDKDLDLSDQIVSLLKEQNLSLDDLKDDNNDLDNIQTIYNNLRQQMSDNTPANPRDVSGVARGMNNQRNDESVMGNTTNESIEQQEEFKNEVNDLTNIIKSLNQDINNTDNEDEKDNLSKMLDENITKLLQLFVSNQKLTEDYLKDQDKTLEDFFQNDLDNIDYLKGILEKHEEELEKWNDEWNESIDYFKSSAKDLFDNVLGSFKGHFNDVFGELQSTFIEPLMNIGASLFEFGKSAFGLTKKPPEEEMVDHLGAINTTLSNMYDADKERDKRDLRNLGDEDGGGITVLGGIAAVVGGALYGLGAVIGSITGRFMSFFTLLGKATKMIGNLLKLSEPVTKLTTMFTTSIRKIEWIDDFLKLLGEMGTKVTGLITRGWNFVNNIPVLGKLFQGIAKGISKFALPLTLFLGAVDFIKGFVESEGNIIEKIQTGLQSAVEGFIDLPVKLLGWIGDKILSLFGAEIEGGTGALMKKMIIDTLMFIPDMITGFFNGIVDGWNSEEGSILNKIMGSLKGAIEGLYDMPTKLIGSIGDKILSLFGIEIESGLGSKMKTIISESLMLIPNMIKDFFTGFVDGWKDNNEKNTLGNLWGAFKTAISDTFSGIFEGISNIFSLEEIKKSIMDKIRAIPGAKWILGEADEETTKRLKSMSSGFGPGPGSNVGMKFEEEENVNTVTGSPTHGPRGQLLESGGPISSMPSGGVSGSMMVLNDIKYILLDKLSKIIQLLSGERGSSSSIMSGVKNSIRSFLNKFKGEDSNVKDVVGVGTELSEVPGSTGKGWIDPMGTGKRITSEYGARIHPVTGKMQGHKGLDMAGPESGMYGYPIKASKDGIVSIAKSLRGYGNVIYMDHDDGYQTRYAHLDSFKVKPGDMVAGGDVIGGMGNTGVGTGPHLHYEIRKDGRPLNPMDVLSAKDGAMIMDKNNNENEFAAKVHPDEAILPLNDNVLTKLGEKIGQYIDFNPSSSSNLDKHIQDLINIIKTSANTQENNHIKFLNSLKEIMSNKENRETIVNNMTSKSSSKDNIPDSIENSMLMLLNTSWGV